MSEIGGRWLRRVVEQRVCCALRDLLRGRNSGTVGVMSLTLKLLVSMFLFTQVTFRLDFSGFCRSSSGLCVIGAN